MRVAWVFAATVFISLSQTGSKASVPAEQEPRSLSSGEYNDRQGRYSPDGAWVAYASTRGARSHIFVMPAAGGAARQITGADYIAIHPTWSPDGKRIAFESDKGGGNCVWTIAVAGGEPARVTPADWIAEWPDWSPQGDRIVFISGRAGSRDVYTVPPNGGEPTRVTTHPGNEWQPRWSPDGKTIAFYSTWNGKMTDIWTVPAEGGTPVQITDHPAEDYQPAWSPDGKWLAFFSRRANRTEILAVPARGGATRALTHGKANLWGGGPDWAPNGRSIVFERAALEHLYSLTVEDGKPMQLTRGPKEERTPVFSPDGRNLLFVTTLFTAERGLALMPASGGRARPLRFEATSGQRFVELQLWATWSGDGKKIAFVQNFGGYTDTRQLWVADADGKNARQLTQMGFVTNPVWCENDRSIIFSSGGHLWKIASSGGMPAQLTKSSGSYAATDYRPSINKIMVQSTERGVTKLYLMTPDTGEMASFETGKAHAEGGRWSPDGAQVAFVSNDGGQFDLYSVSASGGRATRLTNNSDRESAPSWSPDGKRLVFSAGTGRSRLSVIDVKPELLK